MPPPTLFDRFLSWRDRRIADPAFQSWAARFPLTRPMARRDGERLMDLVAGFAHSQVLRSVVALDLVARMADEAHDATTLANETGVPVDRLQVLLQAGTALKLFQRRRDGRYRLGRLGAALKGVPGLPEIIAHHDVLYRDLIDPTAFFRGQTDPDLARFWPYVFGGDVAEDEAARYSDLMADTQTLVAEETLKAVDLSGSKHLLDVGGGSGAFVMAVARAYPTLALSVFDLPDVAAGAAKRFAAAGMADRVRSVPGSFRADPLPGGADAISLVRVLYDHQSETVRPLLAQVFAALPPGGRVLISEPMSGGAKPQRAGDGYFAIYCMAMGTGRVRSPAEIAALLADAGFSEIRTPRVDRSFITQVVTARKL